MSLAIRPFAEADHAAARAIAAAVAADYPLADTWHAGAQYEEGDGPLRWVAVDAQSQAVVGYAALREARPPRYRLRIMVHPEWERHGAGGMLYRAVLAAAEVAGAATLQARVRKTKTGALEFLYRRGFAFIHEMVGLRLDLGRYELGAFMGAVARVRAQGIEITTLAQEQAAGAEWLGKFCALQMAVLEGWADPDPGPQPHVTPAFFARSLDPAKGHEEEVFIAKAGDKYVGYGGSPFMATAVAPAYRNRGLATALKVLIIQNAKARGVPTLMTCSASPAMIAINTKLGYVAYCTEVRLRKMVRGF